MRIINPYSGINFSTVQSVRSITHEHIYAEDKWKSCYDRGIRHFAAMHYQPSAPRFPASNFYYKIEGSNPVLWPYIDFVNLQEGDFDTKEWTLQGRIISFVDKDGNTILTDNLPQIPNNEHPTFTRKLGETTKFLQHFNVLGNLWPECGWGVQGRAALRSGHPLSDLDDFANFFNSANQYWTGKLLFTINHTTARADALTYINAVAGRCPIAFEVFNDDYTDARNEQFVRLYDELLSDGFRLQVTAVVDWQGYISLDMTPAEEEYWQAAYDALPPEEKAQYEDYKAYYAAVGRTRNYDCGCNVLYVPAGYDNLPANDFLTIDGKSYPNKDSETYTKAEAGLDSYIAGTYFASAFGNHQITDLSVSANRVAFSVDNAATSVVAVSNLGRTEVSGNSISVLVKPGMKYIRFEARFNNDEKPDFIYTNPLFIEDNEEKSEAERILLLL